MSHTMTTYEIHALHNFAVALRPDWAYNRCGSTWQQQLGGNTFPHADDFLHAMRALHVYATMTATDGTPVKRTPKFFPGPGDWWTETRRASDPQAPPCAQHGTDYGNRETCKACRSEILAGHRPESFMGEYYEPSNPSEAQPPASPENPNTDPKDPPATPQASQNHAQEEN